MLLRYDEKLTILIYLKLNIPRRSLSLSIWNSIKTARSIILIWPNIKSIFSTDWFQRDISSYETSSFPTRTCITIQIFNPRLSIPSIFLKKLFPMK